MSYLLPLGEVVPLQKAVERGSVVIFQSAFWNPDAAGSDDNTSVNLLDQGDFLLQIAIRNGENAIVFNTRTANGKWGTEEREPLQGSFVRPNTSITVYDHGNRFEILFSGQTVHYYDKRINRNATSVFYKINQQSSPFSDPLVVSTFTSMSELFARNSPAHSETRPVPPLDIPATAGATTKATFCHGVGPVKGPGPKKQDRLGFEYTGHRFLGDTITLTLTDGTAVVAEEYRFGLPNGLHLTYGEINILAGDFYGTKNPISDGASLQDQSRRFNDAYATLANPGPRQPQEARAILSVLQKEVDAINKALQDHDDPSTVYRKLPDETTTLEKITCGRSGIPGYLGLAQINWDHFGADARIAYIAGHWTALQLAITGELDKAYAMNAFADHFLEDSFSAGHLRTPRRLLHSNLNPAADLCAKYMHDEDNTIGLQVQNAAGQTWTAYGDKRALDKVGEDNKSRCANAVQASADEVYEAWRSRVAPSIDQYKARSHAPTLASAQRPQELAPLFTDRSERRAEITGRRKWTFTESWCFATTAAACWNSGWWKYPITMDGPQKILSGSAVSATPTDSPYQCHVYFQDDQGCIRHSKHEDGRWVGGGHDSALVRAKMFSPLAVTSWSSGAEIRIYYLSQDYILQECCYSASKGWYHGSLNNLRTQAAPNSMIAAVQWNSPDGVCHIRVYYQAPTSDAIQEYCHEGSWNNWAALPTAVAGSSLAAIRWLDNSRNIHIRLYYQDPGLALREHCWDDHWYRSGFEPGRAPRHSSIAALGQYTSDIEIHVYWQNEQQNLVGMSWNGSAWGSISDVFGPLLNGKRIAAVSWDDEKSIRIYYQEQSQDVMEQCNDGNGWFIGATVAS